jgi:flagellar basal-body rod protein FlgB
MFTNDITTATLTAAMRGGMARQSAIAQNIANADTPGYQRMTVSFEGALADALAEDRAGASTPTAAAMSQQRAVDTVRPSFQINDTTQVRVDGSNFDPDAETAELAANEMAYNTNTRLLTERFRQISMAVTGR